MHRTKRTLYGAMLAVGILAGAPWAITQAVWGDSASVDANTFQTGTVDISASPASALLGVDGMAPGDVVTAPLDVSNAGSIDLRYAMSTSLSGSGPLANALALRVKSGVSDCSTSGFAADGTSLYDGALSGGAFGDAAQGAQAGDRSLASGASETLCFQAELPSGASDTLQGASVTATFVFDAEQTANNA